MKITDYLAIYAAGLSTIVFIWNAFQSRPRIKVDLIYGIEGSGENLESGVYIFVRNLSAHDVHLSNMDILYPYMVPSLKQRLVHMWKFKTIPTRLGWVHSRLSNFSVESGCPICLEARKSHKVFIPDSTLETMLAKAIDRSLMACVQDQLWSNVYSGKFEYTVPSLE